MVVGACAGVGEMVVGAYQLSFHMSFPQVRFSACWKYAAALRMLNLTGWTRTSKEHYRASNLIDLNARILGAEIFATPILLRLTAQMLAQIDETVIVSSRLNSLRVSGMKSLRIGLNA